MFASGWASRSGDGAMRYSVVFRVEARDEALAALAAWLRAEPAPAPVLRWVTRCWTTGTLLFSGSLYVLALGGPRWLGPVTPLGGVALLAGWLLLALAARRGGRTE